MSHAKLKDRGDDRVVDLVECDQVVQPKNKNIDESVLGINNSIVTAIPMDVWISSLMSSRPDLTVRTMREGSLRATRKEKKKKRLNLNPEASFIVPKVSHLSQAVLELKEGYCFRSAATGHGCTKR